MEDIVKGLSLILEFENIILILGGVLIGVLVGALPGLSSPMAIALLIPFTITLDPVAAIAMMAALYCAGTFGGSITAILINAPGALINNNGVKFKSRQVSLRAENIDTIFTNKIPRDKKMFMPIAHRQGNYLADKETLEQISDNGQIAFTYTSDAGGNPNGSCLNIAGIFNKNKNILGMMPHPERASDILLGSNDGALIFQSMMEYTN